eukprot:2519069-Alexandrium_andersonii.AAC.1
MGDLVGAADVVPLRAVHGWVAGRDPGVRVEALGKVLPCARGRRLADAVHPRGSIDHLSLLGANKTFGNNGEVAHPRQGG